jgi:VanZ family protein
LPPSARANHAAASTFSLWMPVAVYMACIFVSSSISSPPDAVSLIPDTLSHAALYFGLGALLVRGLAGGFDRHVSVAVASAAVIIATAYGATDELHQHFVPERQMDVRDLVADALGSSLAAAGLYVRSRFRL